MLSQIFVYSCARIGGSTFVLNSLRLLNKRPTSSQTIAHATDSLVNKDNLFYPEDKNRFARVEGRGAWNETWRRRRRMVDSRVEGACIVRTASGLQSSFRGLNDPPVIHFYAVHWPDFTRQKWWNCTLCTVLPPAPSFTPRSFLPFFPLFSLRDDGKVRSSRCIYNSDDRFEASFRNLWQQILLPIFGKM